MHSLFLILKAPILNVLTIYVCVRLNYVCIKRSKCTGAYTDLIKIENEYVYTFKLSIRNT